MSTSYTTTIAAEEAIKSLVARAARAVDSADYTGFAQLFAPEGVLQRPGAAPLTGRDAIVASYSSRPAGRITRHLVTNTVVTLSSPTTAQAESYVLLWTGDESQPVTPFGRQAHDRQVVGEFSDKLVLIDSEWLISHREARFILNNGPVNN